MCNFSESAGIWDIFSTTAVFPRIDNVFYSMPLGLCDSKCFFSSWECHCLQQPFIFFPL